MTLGRDDMKEFLTSIQVNLGLAWWVEIITDNPNCTYYFGPFFTQKEAESEKSGYVEDLLQEGSDGIQVKIKRCKPVNLTTSEDLGSRVKWGISPA